MDIDSPVRAGLSVPVTGAVTEPVTATAMEGVSVEVEGLPGPLTMVVYTGGAGGAAAEIGAAIATEPSPVQSAAPVTLPVAPVPSRPKREAARLGIGERRSPRVAKTAVASPESEVQPVPPGTGGTGETVTGAAVAVAGTSEAVVTGAGTIVTGANDSSRKERAVRGADGP